MDNNAAWVTCSAARPCLSPCHDSTNLVELVRTEAPNVSLIVTTTTLRHWQALEAVEQATAPHRRPRGRCRPLPGQKPDRPAGLWRQPSRSRPDFRRQIHLPGHTPGIRCTGGPQRPGPTGGVKPNCLPAIACFPVASARRLQAGGFRPLLDDGHLLWCSMSKRRRPPCLPRQATTPHLGRRASSLRHVRELGW